VALVLTCMACGAEEEELAPAPPPYVRVKLQSITPIDATHFHLVIGLTGLPEGMTYSGGIYINSIRYEVSGSTSTIELDTTSALELASTYQVMFFLKYSGEVRQLIETTSVQTPPPVLTGPDRLVAFDTALLTFTGAGVRSDMSIEFGVRATPTSAEVVEAGGAFQATSTGATVRAPVLLATDPMRAPRFAGPVPPVKLYLKGRFGTFSTETFRVPIGEVQHSYLFSRPTPASARAGSEITIFMLYPLRVPGPDITLQAKMGDAVMTFVSTVETIDLVVGNVLAFGQRVKYRVPQLAPGTYTVQITDSAGVGFANTSTFDVLP
jgi:hypothetical protein